MRHRNLENYVGNRLEIVGAQIDGQVWYGCYQFSVDGRFIGAGVIDGRGNTAPYSVAKAHGVWPQIGLVQDLADFVLLGGFVVATAVGVFFYYRKPRPARAVFEPISQRPLQDLVLGLTGGALLPVLLMRRQDQERKARLAYQTLLGWFLVFCAVPAYLASSRPDVVSVGTTAAVFVLSVSTLFAGRALLPPADWDYPFHQLRPRPSGMGIQAESAPDPQNQPRSIGPPALRQGSLDRTIPPDELPRFCDVKELDGAKQVLSEVFALTGYGSGSSSARLGQPSLPTSPHLSGARVLVHGPRGSGKSLLAKATAGEFGLNLILACSDEILTLDPSDAICALKDKIYQAQSNLPSLLVLEDIDARTDEPPEIDLLSELVNALAAGRHHQFGVLITASSAQFIDQEALERGRFNDQAQTDLPGRAARTAIIRNELADRPTDPYLDIRCVADMTVGWDAHTVIETIARSSMQAPPQIGDNGRRIFTAQSFKPTQENRTSAHPSPVRNWPWTRLVLDPVNLDRLRDRVGEFRNRRLDSTDPIGLVLAGPSGTGRTTAAKIAASSSRRALYEVSATDFVGRWPGESRDRVSRFFARCCSDTPPVILINDIHRLAQCAEESPSTAEAREWLIAELNTPSSMASLVLVSTDHADDLSTSLVNTGRLSDIIAFNQPNKHDRILIIELLTNRIELGPAVSINEIAGRTDGYTGRDLQALVDHALDLTRRHLNEVVTPMITRASITTALRYNADRPTKSMWDDLVLDEFTLAELRGLVTAFTAPRTAAEYGLESPSGVLLWGPPGSGKTMIGRILAGESNCNFIAFNAQDLDQTEPDWDDLLGKLFRQARNDGPSIIFIDDIGALAYRQDVLARYGSAEPGDPIKTDHPRASRSSSEPLVALRRCLQDKTNRKAVLVIGTTRHPELIDSTLLTGSMLSTHLLIGWPTKDQRSVLLRRSLALLPTDESVSVDELAEKTNGLTAGGIEALCRQASLVALEDSTRRSVDTGHPTRRPPRITSLHFALALRSLRGGDPRDDSPQDVWGVYL